MLRATGRGLLVVDRCDPEKGATYSKHDTLLDGAIHVAKRASCITSSANTVHGANGRPLDGHLYRPVNVRMSSAANRRTAPARTRRNTYRPWDGAHLTIALWSLEAGTEGRAGHPIRALGTFLDVVALPSATESGAPVAESAVDTGTFPGSIEGWEYEGLQQACTDDDDEQRSEDEGDGQATAPGLGRLLEHEPTRTVVSSPAPACLGDTAGT